ncbi:MAG: hypothetical protein Q8891_07460 [Bacteroidota bacterium]|nr:hypothetical protein [Bacteroidota bacterium]
MTSNTSSSRIGIEIRNADGKNPFKEFITPKTGSANFLAIKPVSNRTTLIDYTKSVNNKDYVKYRLVSW